MDILPGNLTSAQSLEHGYVHVYYIHFCISIL